MCSTSFAIYASFCYCVLSAATLEKSTSLEYLALAELWHKNWNSSRCPQKWGLGSIIGFKNTPLL